MNDRSPSPIDTSRTTIGSYEVIRVLGQGATGITYLARGRSPQSEVVIKILHRCPSGEAYRRLVRQVAIVRRLAHRHLVRVVGAGEDAGVPFLVMERLHGKSLREVIKDNPAALDASTRIDLVAQLCLGLQHAHEQGLVHRDVRPANVFLTDDGVIKILDLGVARFGDTTATADGTAADTLGYTAPEQLSADTLIDGRADIFSAAVVLYELIAGRRPFGGDSTAAPLMQTVHQDPPPLKGAPQLDEIIRRALQKDPGARYGTAQEFAYALWMTLLAPAPAFLPTPTAADSLPPTVFSGNDVDGAPVDVSKESGTVFAEPQQTRAPANPYVRPRRPKWAYAAVAGGVLLLGAAALAAILLTRPPPVRGADADVAPPISAAAAAAGVPPEPRTVTVESNPSGATIVSDGQPLGQTPATLTLRVDQVLGLELLGYESARITLDAASLSAGRLSITLSPLTQYQFRASGSYPFEIVVDDRVVSVAATTHDITVTSGQTARLRSRRFLLDLPVLVDRPIELAVPAAGRLWVRPPPADEQCTVVIDRSGGSLPPFDVVIASGSHDIEFRCPDGRVRRSRVTIAPGSAEVVR